MNLKKQKKRRHKKIKRRFLCFLYWQDGPAIAADSIEALQSAARLDDVSKTVFWRAVRSLAYKPGRQKIIMQRPRNLDGSRGVEVWLLP